MSGEAWLYLLAVIVNAVNLFLQVFFTIMYSDLEWYVHAVIRSVCLAVVQFFQSAHSRSMRLSASWIYIEAYVEL